MVVESTQMANKESDEMDAEPPRTTIEEHQRTYDAFMSLTKWSIAGVVLLLILLAVFLV